MRTPLSIVAATTMFIASVCPGQEHSEHQAEVARRGSEVMSFDLERSTHVFETTDSGGVQTVTSDDGDAEQVELIRGHMAEIAERFSHGDFHDPEMIHGKAMAGLHELQMGHDRLSITYSDVDDGGEIRYETEDPSLIEAIHAWFGAQLEDHGRHAQPHH